jgi:MFS family permease
MEAPTMADSTLTGVASDVGTGDGTVPEALQKPTKRVGVVFSTVFLLSNLALWLKFAVLTFLIPAQLPGMGITDGAQQAFYVSIVGAIGSAFALVANPVFGAFSDRTTGRFGRRRPYLIVGGILGAAAAGALAFAGDVITLIVAWTVFQIAANMVLAALGAIVPDKVPGRQRGLISSFAGFSIPLGILVSAIFATVILRIKQVDASGQTVSVPKVSANYYLIGGALLVTMLLMALVLRDTPLPKFRLGSFLASFWINPIKYGDFAWAWLSRFFMLITSAIVTVYTVLFLRDYIGLGTGANSAATTFDIVYILVLVACSIVGGIISDRTQRRKPLVFLGGLFAAAGMALLALVHQMPGDPWMLVLVSAVLFGLGYGVYLSVDFALVTLVLPSERSRGKDLGILNIANTLPQVLAPGLGALLFAAVAGSTVDHYQVLFAVAAGSALLGGLVIWFVRGVR